MDTVAAQPHIDLTPVRTKGPDELAQLVRSLRLPDEIMVFNIATGQTVVGHTRLRTQYLLSCDEGSYAEPWQVKPLNRTETGHVIPGDWDGRGFHAQDGAIRHAADKLLAESSHE